MNAAVEVRAVWRGRSSLEMVCFFGLLVITLSVFAPTLYWLSHQAVRHAQLLDALLVLGLAVAALLMQRGNGLRFECRFKVTATARLAAAFVLVALAMLSHAAWLVLAGFCLALSAWVLALFGVKASRMATALIAAFTAFILLVLAMETLDWPLRIMGGRYAGWLLHLIGYHVQLALMAGGDWKLLLLVNGKPFVVAPECNGFGLIGSAILLSILLTTYQRLGWVDKAISVLAAAFLGSLGNTLRIFVICVLASKAGAHYGLLHESAGLLFYWLSLGLIWWLSWGRRAQPPEADKLAVAVEILPPILK